MAFCLAFSVQRSAFSDEPFVLDTLYENFWFFDSSTTNVSTPAGGPYSNYFGPYPSEALTNASTPLYHGTAGPYSYDTNTLAPVTPSNGLFVLEYSAFGHPVEGLIPDFGLGALITPPAGANTNVPPAGFVAVKVGNNANAYYESADGGVFWAPSTREFYAAQPNNVEVNWIMLDGTTNTMVYMISAIPVQRPARLFWTESPYDAPPVNLDGLFPVIHYNSEVPPPVFDVTTNVNGGVTNITTNIVAGVWIDGQKRMRGTDVTGMILVEYYKTGTYEEEVEPDSVEVVEVLPPQIHTRDVDLGERLLPRDTYWSTREGEKGLVANIQAGLDSGAAFMHTQTGPKDGWVWAVRTTTNDPWSIEIYWEHEGLMGVNWPYEVDWYSAGWPEDPQLVVYGAGEADTAPVLVPSGITPTLQYEEPELNTVLSASGRSVYAKTNGMALLKFTTHDNVWFESIMAVRYDDPVYFDPASTDWPVGTEIVPMGRHTHALQFDPAESNYVKIGKSFLNAVSNWTFTAWINPGSTNPGTIYSEGDPLVTFGVGQSTDMRLHVNAWHHDYPGNWMNYYTPANALATGRWQFISVTLSGGAVGTGTVTVAIEDNIHTGTLQMVYHPNNKQALIGATSWNPPHSSFDGAVEQVRVWKTAFEPEYLWSNRYQQLNGAERFLLADFPCREGEGSNVFNTAGPYDGVACGEPEWIYGIRLPNTNDPPWPVFAGYIHRPRGLAYNVNRYNYPTEADPDASSYVFAVNTGTIEVWWAESTRNTDMPSLICYPYLVQRYNAVWPRYADEIVIASGKGSSGRQGGYALYFDANHDYVTAPDVAAHHLTTGLTMEAWVNLAGAEDDQKILCKATAGSAGYILGVRGGKLYPAIWDATGAHYGFEQGSVPTGRWTHLAVTFAQGGDLVGYIDGVEIGRVSAGANALTNSGLKLTMGRASWDSTLGVKGDIDDVRIWGVERSSNEIVAAMHALEDDDRDGLVAWYPFEASSGSTAYDHSESGADAAIYAAAWVVPGHPGETENPYRDWVFGSPQVYYQNDRAQDGYNPNEEHALIMGGAVYALRNDLNVSTSSQPFVLVDYLDPDTTRPAMHAFCVYATNAIYAFDYSVEAGAAIVPPMPVGEMPLCTNNYRSSGPAWEDRKDSWWAKAAGDDGGPSNAVMRFYYAMEPSFCFPSRATQPPAGAELPWLPTNQPPRGGGADGTPVGMTYEITWPEEVPEMKVAETLTMATRGLPDIWHQLSVEILYQQSDALSNLESVALFDPVVAHGVDLEFAVIESMEASELAKKETIGNKYWFPALPPSLYPRIYYDPDAGTDGQLVLEGVYVETLTGGGYLLLNMLDDREVAKVKGIADSLNAADRGKWQTAVGQLHTSVTLIQPNNPYVNAALSAGLGRGVGYVTLAFNNSTNVQQVPPALPISLSIIKVIPELYDGILEPIEPENALDEKFSMRYGADFAGKVNTYDFQWRWAEPEGGLIPDTNFMTSSKWFVYEPNGDIANGALTVDIEGASPFTLADHYFAVRYRLHDETNGPTGTNWSEWVYNLAPGWIDRVVNGITPFEQRLADMVADPANTTFSMLSQAGPPYEGPIALNMDYIDDFGLLQIYETVLERAKEMSLDAGINDEAINESLLNVVSRINDLYMVLGNEAYADALDPTIAFGKDNQWLTFENYAAEATGLFAFMNQVPTLLDEELVMLRGRDDTLEPSVETSPIFNRFIWNYTRGIDGGEVVYALNYNIKGNPTNLTGTITAEDAKRLYPQGHGDAWGYYLSALQSYYDLLGNTNFGWQTKPGAMLVGNAAVSVDYFDERKFAESAAAKARTGAEIVSRTYRKDFRELADNQWQSYRDGSTNRAWGVDGWASRAGQGAYFDWAVGNSLLLYELTNLVQVGGDDAEPEGIQKIDRTTVPELQEVCSALEAVQAQADNADAGFNPLGLADDVVPFDISPAEIDAGKTHFEQIYERAVIALQNAETAFNHVKGCTRDMRAQADSIYQRQMTLAQQELDFHNRLIEIYGYPYPDDIGPGKTYPQGYCGPDLINYQILDLEDLVGTAPTGTPLEIEIYRYDFSGSYDVSETNVDYTLTRTQTGTSVVWIAENGLKVKPSTWTGRRPASGEIQLALMDYIQAYYQLKAKAEYYEDLMEWLEKHYDFLEDMTKRYVNNWVVIDANADREKETSRVVEGLKITMNLLELVSDGLYEIMRGVAGVFPKEAEGLIGPFPYAAVEENVGQTFRVIAAGVRYVQFLSAHTMEAGIVGREQLQARWNVDVELQLETNEYANLIQEQTLEFTGELRQQLIRESEMLAQLEAFKQAYQRYLNIKTQGELLMVKRAQIRAQFAHRIQEDRYADMAFRIFRNEALQKYTAAFDLAARYVYLAAKAYDYETALLDTETSMSPGSEFLSDIVRARSLGVLANGEPQAYGGSGDPGLADIMARMKADWDVVKTRFGFNNPDTETSRFSLRSELLRISPSSGSDGTWQAALEDCVVDDLNQWDVFRQHCKPFTSSTEPQPALVIPFDTTVMFGKNFFGRDLAGGDNAYDASHQATKVRSVGVWFTGYNITFNTNDLGGGLANEPRVYLVPVGEDVMRTPTGEHDELRHWQVCDQVMPLPYNVGGADLDDPNWIPVYDSLSESIGQVRRYASLRAYHDRGQFDEAETHNNARLIGRSVWNTQWYLVIPGGTLLDDADEGIQRFIYGLQNPDGTRDGNGIKDIKIFFQTYSIWGE
ncbi:MAG: LamG domain-containing protein [Phycisphaerae bacterium]|nr:LamG domain-containing protein [Phycisphaerae bacterium]